jgi:Zn finger protein HypA/HybF involved in hydrogenase expression
MNLTEPQIIKCPSCKKRISLKASEFMKLFEQDRGFTDCPHCDAVLYTTVTADAVILENINTGELTTC